MRNAQKRKNSLPKPDIGPMCEAVDPTNDPLTPRDVGGLVDEKDYFSAAETPLLRPKAMSPSNTPPTRSLTVSLKEDEPRDQMADVVKATVDHSKANKPRITVALSCSDTVNNDENTQKEQRQSLFDISDHSSVSSSDDDDDDDEDEDGEAEHSPDDDVDEDRDTANEISISIKSRTAKDSTRASILRRTSSTSATMPNVRLVRSRGESIGLADCSQDPMVLAAGIEKQLKSSNGRGRLAVSASAARGTRESYVYRASGGGRVGFQLCPGREALGIERERSKKGRNRGETV